MAIRVTSHVVGIDELRAELQAIADRGGNPREAFDDVERDFREHMMPAVFRSEGGSIGARWKAWSASYRRRKKPGTMLNLANGSGLYESFTSMTDRYKVRQTTKDSVKVGSRHPLAHLHDQGAGSLPRRRLVKVTENDAERWAGYIAD
jgi:hypothetical protein